MSGLKMTCGNGDMPPQEEQDKVSQPRREMQERAKADGPRGGKHRELSSAARRMHGPNSNAAQQRLLRCPNNSQRG
jgi:hypothetical protein